MHRNKKIWPINRKSKAINIGSVLKEVHKLCLLVDKDFKSSILNMFKELRKLCLKNYRKI